MLKRMTALITLFSFVLYMTGCYTSQEIPKEQFYEYRDFEITSAVTYDGRIYEFVSGKTYLPAYMVDSLIVGYVQLMGYPITVKKVEVPVAEVKTIYVEHYDAGNSCLAGIGITLGVIGIVFLIALATKESCPFVYSFDGENYVFDGEPYGGAICPALERTDYCLLENLKPFKNQYLLQLTNEVDETQFTNEFKLWVVDHPQNVSVIPDIDGSLFTISNPLKPLKGAANGVDIIKWIDEKDLLFWDSDMRNLELTEDMSHRDTLTLSFPKPEHANKVKLVVNGGTTLWGSQMLKKMTEIRGTQVDNWYKSLENPIMKAQLDYWNDREELYQLQVKINVDGRWINKGEIWGGGPFVTEDRVITLDVSDVNSGELNIMLLPPKGFWTFNSFAVDYSAEQPYKFLEISATEITSDDGVDLRNVLEFSDDNYYEMPETGQRAYLKFPVPEFKTNHKRSVFAKVSGYYDIHMNKSGEPQNELIRKIAFEPEFPVKYSISEYKKWVAELINQTASK